jgi:outer membrane lipoprotein carrier protein
MYLEKLLVTLLAAPVLAPVPTTVAHQVVAQAPAQQAPAPAAPPKAPAPKAPEAAKAPEKKVAPEVKDLVDRMQAFYEKTQDFSSDFKQDYKYKALRRTQSSTGTVIYKKPALMRWEYEKPSKRTFVLAGEKVYAYDPEAQTLSVGRIDTSQLSASVTFLFGQGKLADEFSISKGECKDCKGTLLVLDPLKNEPRFRQVRLEVDPKTAQVLKSTVVDPDGSENAIAFLNLKTNVGIDADRFKINPPEGTRIDDFSKMRK